MTQRHHQGGDRGWTAARKGVLSRLRFTSLRLRLVVVFGLVALTAAVSASGIAYWLNREAVLTRTQDAVLRDFEQEMQNRAGALPERPTQDELQHTAGQMAGSDQRFSVLLVASNADGRTVYGSSGGLSGFSLRDVPVSLRTAVNKTQKVDGEVKHPHHLYWQRVVDHDTPYLVAG
ncbi:two-component sensor histidine kinase, partial [Streptomyces coeruleorubidus]